MNREQIWVLWVNSELGDSLYGNFLESFLDFVDIDEIDVFLGYDEGFGLRDSLFIYKLNFLTEATFQHLPVLLTTLLFKFAK